MRYPSKEQFLSDIHKEHRTLLELIEDLDDRDFLESGVCGVWSLKDMLAHLNEWHKLALSWYQAGLKGKTPQMPTPSYKWSQIRDLNKAFYLKNKDKSLASVRSRFTRSHQEMIKLIDSLPEDELLQPGAFAWTKKYPLTTYLHPNTSGHYRWAIRHIKRWLKHRQTG